MQNASAETFNDKFRDECLNGHRVRSLVDAREIIGAWCENYNQRPPRSAYGYQIPGEIAAI
jgi:putative transposase